MAIKQAAPVNSESDPAVPQSQIKRQPAPINVTSKVTPVPLSQIDRAPAPLPVTRIPTVIPLSGIDKAPEAVTEDPRVPNEAPPIVSDVAEPSEAVLPPPPPAVDIPRTGPIYLPVAQDGEVIVQRTALLNFLGNGVTVTSVNGLIANVVITGGGGGGNADYGNANVAAYLPTYTGNIGAGNINFTNNSKLQTSSTNISLKANVNGAVELTSHGGNYTWAFDNFGWTILPEADAAYTPVANASILFAPTALAFKAGLADLIFDSAGNLSLSGNVSGNYFIGDGSQLTNLPTVLGNLIENGDSNVRIDVPNGNVTVSANTNSWIFDTTGHLTLPSTTVLVADNGINLQANSDGNISGIEVYGDADANVYAHNNVVIRTDSNGTGNTWTFDSAGNLTLPGNSANINFANGASVLADYATISSLYSSNATTQAINNADGGGTYYNASTLDIDYTAYTGASTLNFDIAYQAPLTANIGVAVSAVSTALIQANTNIQIQANTGTAQTWTFGANGILQAPGNITTLGNISAGNFVGNIANVDIVAGNYTTRFDNLGNVTMSNGTVSMNNLVATGNVTGNTQGYAIGYRDIPQVLFTGNTTVAATDAGKHFYSTQSLNYILTIANNSSVAWPVGTAITVVNRGSGNITVAQATGVSLYLAGNLSAANRIVTTYGMATLLNVAANVWMINGSGIT